eukprot:463922_1
MGHYFTDNQIGAIVKAWHSNSNEWLHSAIYRKIDKDKRSNMNDYQSACNSGASDMNVGHKQSIMERNTEMGVETFESSIVGLERREERAHKRKVHQNTAQAKKIRQTNRFDANKKNKNKKKSYKSCAFPE